MILQVSITQPQRFRGHRDWGFDRGRVSWGAGVLIFGVWVLGLTAWVSAPSVGRRCCKCFIFHTDATSSHFAGGVKISGSTISTAGCWIVGFSMALRYMLHVVFLLMPPLAMVFEGSALKSRISLLVVGFWARCHQVLQRSSACEIASCLASR